MSKFHKKHGRLYSTENMTFDSFLEIEKLKADEKSIDQFEKLTGKKVDRSKYLKVKKATKQKSDLE